MSITIIIFHISIGRRKPEKYLTNAPSLFFTTKLNHNKNIINGRLKGSNGYICGTMELIKYFVAITREIRMPNIMP